MSVLPRKNLQDFRPSLVKRTWRLCLDDAETAIVPREKKKEVMGRVGDGRKLKNPVLVNVELEPKAGYIQVYPYKRQVFLDHIFFSLKLDSTINSLI